ncbi:RusA-like Holliday junction resolvase [Mycobacterium phage Che9c]|uniref:RusA-like resolvase n=1 Tax=Mycobacterium phage Che9c TaxID=2907832 RepID=Q854T6_9CAUD|nr:RusA-like Holliday junction resolvase [Mycobacterium phage Che9c]AAN12622.1 hypothetical protein PBI_CHE9C_64 [Mycobacterium phage Che9c]
MTADSKYFRIDLPWSRPPLTANQRMHWAAKARKTREVRTAAALLARDAPRTDRLVATLHYQPRQQRRRDNHNLWPTVKALVDGLVDAGVVPDDDTEHVSTPEPVIHPAAGTSALWLVLHYPTTEAMA